MRIIFVLPLLALAACQVTKDDKNDQVTVEYNQDVAENAAADIANGAEEAGQAIASGAKEAADTAKNVDVDIDTNKADDNKEKNTN
jgi:hypothetical protein